MSGKAESRRFSCTSCGRCCDRGPEIELGETATLADTFVLRLMFKVYSLPLYENSARAARWWAEQDSTLSLPAALDETRERLKTVSVRDVADKAKGRSLHLTISALTADPTPGRCPALQGRLCGVYDKRPVACRSVPLHYSRPTSSLVGYLDRFVAAPGRECDVSAAAPIVIQDGLPAASIEATRDDGLAVAEADRAWKAQIAKRMECDEAAAAAGLPTWDVVLRNSDRGGASLVSILPAWLVAKDLGLLSQAMVDALCRQQSRLIRAQLANSPHCDPDGALAAMLLEYDMALPAWRSMTPALALHRGCP